MYPRRGVPATRVPYPHASLARGYVLIWNDRKILAKISSFIYNSIDNMADMIWNPRPSCPVCSLRNRLEIDKRIVLSAYPRKRAESLAPILGIRESVMNKHLEHIGGDITGPEDYGKKLLQSLEAFPE